MKTRRREERTRPSKSEEYEESSMEKLSQTDLLALTYLKLHLKSIKSRHSGQIMEDSKHIIGWELTNFVSLDL